MQIVQNMQISIQHFLTPQTVYTYNISMKNLAVKNISGLTHYAYIAVASGLCFDNFRAGRPCFRVNALWRGMKSKSRSRWRLLASGRANQTSESQTMFRSFIASHKMFPPLTFVWGKFGNSLAFFRFFAKISRGMATILDWTLITYIVYLHNSETTHLGNPNTSHICND